MCDAGVHLHILSVILSTFTCNTNQVKDYTWRKTEIGRDVNGSKLWWWGEITFFDVRTVVQRDFNNQRKWALWEVGELQRLLPQKNYSRGVLFGLSLPIPLPFVACITQSFLLPLAHPSCARGTFLYALALGWKILFSLQSGLHLHNTAHLVRHLCGEVIWFYPFATITARITRTEKLFLTAGLQPLMETWY